MCLRIPTFGGRHVLVGLVSLGLAAAAPAADPAPAVLHLVNGSRVSGELRGSEDATVLSWQSPNFVNPLEFPWGAVNAVHYSTSVLPAPAGEYCFELTDDDILFGDLIALTDDEIEISSASIGKLHLRRENIRRFYRRQGAETVYVGPTGLTGWVDPAAPLSYWQDEGGQLFTGHRGATLFGDLGIPDKALIEFEISWKAKPDFILALGVDRATEPSQYGFRFEVWDGELVVVGESNRDADMAIVDKAGALGGEIRVQVCLDQQRRRLILLSRSGKPMATLNIGGAKRPVHSGVRLTNGKGDVRLEHLRVTRWNGVPPRDVRDDQTRLHRTDGSIVYGQLAAYDPVSKQFTIRDGATETRVSHEAVADLFLTPTRFAEKGRAESEKPRALRVACRDGSRFSGELMRVEDGRLTLSCPGVKEPLRLPLADIRSLIPLRHPVAAAGTAAAGRPGRLEIDGLKLQGRLVAGDGPSEAGRLVWKPELGRNASPLAAGLSGRIVYRDPPPPPQPPNVQQPGRAVAFAPAAGIGIVLGRVMAGAPQPATPRRSSGSRPSMHLRTGDTIPCEVVRIDEKGVTFRTPQTDSTFVPNEKIKSVDLVAPWGLPILDEAKRDRLLTLPRMQKDSPPTHLICSKNGDFLRGRIVEMDDAKLKIEVRLETKEIARDRIVEIVWLHADELGDKKTASAVPASPARETRAQALNADGNRLTFVVGKADGNTITGASDVLGACRADLADVDQLLFGTAIEQSADALADHAWKLHHAIEPKFVQAGDMAGSSTGLDSPLVGQPAPPFQLDMLDGTRFKLADHKGRLVVLDFWATWCGPCLQSMPLVDGVIREFPGRDVDFVAVNMEEQPEAVKSMIERHKFQMPVGLDRDGAVAGKYDVSTIPQTVLIDREGKVARLFVGGGKPMADGLRKALQELTAK